MPAILSAVRMCFRFSPKCGSLGLVSLQQQKTWMLVNARACGDSLLRKNAVCTGSIEGLNTVVKKPRQLFTLMTASQGPIPGCFQDSNPDAESVLSLGLGPRMTSGGVGEIRVPCVGPWCTLAGGRYYTEPARCCLLPEIKKPQPIACFCK